jgi:hypothetical protein
MPLQLHAHSIAAEETNQPIEHAADAVMPRVENRPSGQRDETGCQAIDLVDGERAFSFGRPHLHPRDEATEILITLCARDEDGKPPATVDRELCANDGFEPCLLRRLMESRRAVHAIGIEQRNRRIAERRRTVDECFGQRSALQKAEG